MRRTRRALSGLRARVRHQVRQEAHHPAGALLVLLAALFANALAVAEVRRRRPASSPATRFFGRLLDERSAERA